MKNKWLYIFLLIFLFSFNIFFIFATINSNSDLLFEDFQDKTVDISDITVTPPSNLDLSITDPSNHTLSWNLTDDGLRDYLGAYSFTEDANGADPMGWAIIENPNTHLNVIAEQDGHHKVIEMWDDNSAVEPNGITEANTYFPNQTTGTVEFWTQANYNTNTQLSLLLYSGATYGVFHLIRRDSINDFIGIISEPSSQVAFTPDVWYHIRLEFNCSSDKVRYWRNSVYIGEFDFNNPVSSIDRIRLTTSSPYAYNNMYGYFDAIDYSWAPGYYPNRNMDVGPVDYLGAYSFAEDANGADPADWTVYEYTNTHADVVDSLGNHSKVVEFWDNSNIDPDGLANMTQVFSPGHATGTVEFWLHGVEGSGSYDQLYINFHNGTIEAFRLAAAWDPTYEKLENYITVPQTIVPPGQFTNSVWHHLRVEWNCSSTKFWVWHNGASKGEFDFRNLGGNATAIDQICFGTSGVYSSDNFKCYLDAIDYSWAPGYYTNRNMDYTTTEPSPKDYLGTYSFTADSNGSVPVNWTRLWQDSNTAGRVLSEKEGHRKVIELYDNNIVGSTVLRTSFGTKVAGTVEWWFYGTENGPLSSHQLTFHYSGTQAVYLFYNTSSAELFFYNGSYNKICDLTNEQWHHFRLEFDCASDSFTMWVNGVEETTNVIYINDVDYIDTVDLYTGIGSTGGFYVYFDAFDFSWDSGYYLNRNMDYENGTTLEYAIFENGTQKTSWQSWSGQVQVDYNVSAPHFGIGVHNVSLVYNDENGQWYHDDVFVSVNATLVADWNVPPDLDIELEVGRDRDCTMRFNFTNTGNATLVNLNFSIIVLPTGWTAVPNFQVHGQLDPGETLVVSFLITVGPSDKEFIERIDINFTATALETGEPVSDLITVWITGFKNRNLTFWIILIVGSVAAVGTTSFVVIRKRRTTPSQPKSKKKTQPKSLTSLKQAISSEFPGVFSVISNELMERVNNLKDLTDDERVLLIQYINQLEESEAIKFLDELMGILSN